ncbi:hypothetical protein ACFYXP_09645 [Streptomyces sp. NPDC002466]|uniref:hypothetical protein n=1 Tax=Streptomyces sp. NPDC002466 TaxID=3364646 RepID=UPI0036D1ACFA
MIWTPTERATAGWSKPIRSRWSIARSVNDEAWQRWQGSSSWADPRTQPVAVEQFPVRIGRRRDPRHPHTRSCQVCGHFPR